MNMNEKPHEGSRLASGECNRRDLDDPARWSIGSATSITTAFPIFFQRCTNNLKSSLFNYLPETLNKIPNPMKTIPKTPVSKVDTRKKGWSKIRYVSALALLVGSTQPTFSQTYCPSDGGTGNVINIDRVQLGDLDNASGDNDGYGNFTALSVTTTAGTVLPVSLDPSGPFFLRYRWRAWLDLNNDGNFADPGERVLQQSGFGVQNGTVSIPAGTPNGNYRMRISMRAFSNVGPCDNYSLGEVEDYTVTVTSACDALAGGMSTSKPKVCLTEGGVTLSATPDGEAVVPQGFSQAYVLTSGTGLVIEQLGSLPQFTVTSSGIYTIHSFVYPTDLDLSVVVPGTTTGFDVNGLLIQGGGELCASLDVTGAQFIVSDPVAGTMSGGADACFNGGNAMLMATANGDANIPAGYSQAYVLTSGTGLVIEQLGATPEFTVTTGGLYTIHSFVFPSDLDLSVVVPGVTTGFDVNGLLVQGGGSLCASLDVAGAQFNVADPMAGTMSGGADACFNGESAMLMATANGDANIPAGYSQAYVLTSGTGLVIEQLGATPGFTVTTGGLYTIHSFVFPSDLDLSVVVPGVTTGFDVNGLLVQGGGSLCASLDVAGAQFNVSDDCGCIADAGSLTASTTEACLINGQATISANANGDANVPTGYSQAYVLTSGTGLVIEQLGATPEFTVTSGGLYTIHSFVFPSNLDLSIVVPGVTTGFDVNGLLIQGGGELCASLDVAGAPVQVSGPFAGNIDPDNFLNCLSNGSTTLNGNPAGDAQVPAGYSTVYVLTRGQGLVIVNAGATPEFTVTQTGLYRIHTLVYDANTLDLGIVVPGTTTGFDVNSLLVQGGGTICASLDVSGAPFLVLNGWICNFFQPLFINEGMDPMDQLSDALGRDASSMSDAELNSLTSEVPVKATLYPVPATDILNISLETRLPMNMEVSVLDMSGRIVRANKSYDLEAGVRNFTIDVNDLDNGNYLVRMVTNGEVITEQFVKVQ